MATTTSLGFNIFSAYNDRGTRQAENSIQRLERTLNNANGSTKAFGSSMAKTMGIMAAPSVMPLAAGLAAVAGGMTAVAVTAGVAGGVFGATMTAAIKKTMEMRDAGEALNGAQLSFVKSVDAMKKSWNQFLMASADKTLGVARDAVVGFNAGIKQMPALIDAVYPSIKSTSAAFKDWMEGDGLKLFVAEIQDHGVPALDSMQRAGRDLLGFLGAGFRAFLPVGAGMAEALARGAFHLHQWADAGGFQRFIDNAMKNMPTIKEFFRALSEALKNVLKAFIELGPASLAVTTEILKLIAAVSTDTIKAFLIGLLVAKALYTTALAINAITFAVRLLSAAFIGTPIGWIVLAIAGLVAVIILIATKTTWFQDLWAKIWPVIKYLALSTWEAIKVGVKALVDLWQRVWPVIRDVAMSVWEALKSAWNSLVEIWTAIWPKIMSVAMTVWDALKAAWGVVWAVMVEIYEGFIVPLIDSWKTLWPEIKATAEIIWNWISSTWEALWSAFSSVAGFYWDVMMVLWKALWPIIAAVATAVWDGLSAAWGALWGIISGIWNAFISAFGPVFGTLWNGIVSVAVAIWDVLKAAWNAVLDFFTAIFMVVMAIFTGHWGKAWDAIKTAAQSIWDLIVALWNLVLDTIVAALKLVAAIIVAAWNFLWDSIVAIAKGIWDGLVAAWQFFVDLVWGILRAGLEAITVIWNAVWGAIKESVLSVWNGITDAAHLLWVLLTSAFQGGQDWLLKTFWDPLYRFFTETIPNAFTKAVEFIGKAWDSIKKVVRDPIQAVVDTVYNDGIVAVWSKVAKAFGADELERFELPQFARGGPVWGRGTSTSDSIMARLSNNEHVWTAREVTAAGGHGAVAALRSAVMGGKAVRAYGTTSFAEGGGVLGSIGSFLSGGLEKLGNLAKGAIYPAFSGLIDRVASAGVSAVRGIVSGDNRPLEQFGVGVVNKMADTIKSWVKTNDVAPAAGAPWNGTIAPGALGRMQEWALGQRGGRYAWGGVSDKAMDCSGMVGNLWALATGNPLYRRYMTTYTMGAGLNGMQAGPGNFTIYLKQGGPGGGHTSANVGGLHVEAYGGDGTPFAIGSIGTPLSYFDQVLHLPGLRSGGGVGLSQLSSREGAFMSWLTTGWPEMYGNGTHGARSGWALTGDRGPEWVHFRGGEKVLPNGQTPPTRRGEGAGDHFEFHIDARGATTAAVRMLEQETIPKLRVMLHQGVGKKGR